MACPDAESLAQLATAGDDDPARAVIVDHAASCERCHAALEAILDDDDHAYIGRYRVKRQLGAGGMGVVWLAHDPELGRDVAIKMMRRGGSPDRLRREARALARLSHPNVVAVHDVGEHEGEIFVTMALVDGQDLRRWLSTPRSGADILRVLRDAARGIIAAHAVGIVHRDLKPENIFVATGGGVLVGDFGLARDDDGVDLRSSGTTTSDPDTTRTGTILGTPAYMAPEQASGDATALSDQFSFCVMAYEALGGMRPYGGASAEAILASVSSGVVAHRELGVSPTVERAILRGLRPAPADRFASMVELAAAIAPPVRRWPYVVAAGVGIALVAATAMVVRRDVTEPSELCAPARSLVERSWNPLQRIVLANGLRARRAQPTMIGELDRVLHRYATAWSEARYATCIADTTRAITAPIRDARIACLDARKTELDLVLASLATEANMEVAWSRVLALAPPDACRSDDAALLSSGPQARQQILRELAAAPYLEDPPFAALRERASNDLPALLAIAMAEAIRAVNNGAYADADAALDRARPLAETVGATSARVTTVALSARSSCMQHRIAEAKPFLAMADAAAARLRETEHGSELDEVLLAHAECAYRAKDFASALPRYLELVSRTQARFGANTPAEYEFHERLAQIYLHFDRMEDVARESNLSEAIAAQLVPAPDVAGNAEHAPVNAKLARGDLVGAIESTRRACARYRIDGSEKFASCLVSLAQLYELSADWKLAIATYTDALPALASNPTRRAEALEGRGWSRLEAAAYTGALEDLEAVRVAATELHRPDLELSAKIGLGHALLATNESGRAARMLEGVVTAYRSLPDASPYRIAIAMFDVARSQWAADRTAARETILDAETEAASALTAVKTNALGRAWIPLRARLLADIERWRDAHR